MIEPHNDHLPVGMTTQLAEYCTGIAKVKVRVPFKRYNITAKIISKNTPKTQECANYESLLPPPNL